MNNQLNENVKENTEFICNKLNIAYDNKIMNLLMETQMLILM